MQKVLTSMMLRSVAFSGRPSAVLGRMGVGGGPLAGTGEGAEWEILVRPLVSVPRREYVRWRGGSTHWQRGKETMAQALDTWQIRASCRGPQAEIFFPPCLLYTSDAADE